MSIPTAFDGKLYEIGNLASSVLLKLRTIRHANQRDQPSMRVALRDHLEEYVDLVMKTANEINE